MNDTVASDVPDDEEPMMQREDVEIDDPCEASWAEMRGTGRQRHCGHCDQEVVNLSRMTEAEAESFLEANHSPCVRYHLSADGELLFQTQLERQRRGAETLVRAATVLVPLIVGGAALAAGMQSPAPEASARAVSAEADAPDLVALLDDETASLSEGLHAGARRANTLVAAAARRLPDASEYVAERAETSEQPDAADTPDRPVVPKPSEPDHDGPVLMGDIGSEDLLGDRR